MCGRDEELLRIDEIKTSGMPEQMDNLQGTKRETQISLNCRQMLLF